MMNIVTGCIISCELIYEPAISYVPLKVKVVNDEYLKGDKGNTFHYFEVQILEHTSPSRYNKYFPLGEIVQARAGDLYHGMIIEYPENYEQLCLEKELKKQAVNNTIPPSHTLTCPTCGKIIDMRDLGQVLCHGFMNKETGKFECMTDEEIAALDVPYSSSKKVGDSVEWTKDKKRIDLN